MEAEAEAGIVREGIVSSKDKFKRDIDPRSKRGTPRGRHEPLGGVPPGRGYLQGRQGCPVDNLLGGILGRATMNQE